MNPDGRCTEDIPDGSLISHKYDYGHELMGNDLCVKGSSCIVHYPHIAIQGMKNVILWEQSDLLKLKAAVEKALEVTPKPMTWSVRSVGSISCNGELSTQAVQVGNNCDSRSHTFSSLQDAEEYVAWKNAQEKP
jgi:hypothetical protein